CGNSLASPNELDTWWDEIYGAMFTVNDDAKFRINAFDWISPTLGFGRVLAARSGFDAIIGNPPYVRAQVLRTWAPEECDFYKRHYRSATGSFDIYVLFLERCFALLSEGGVLGFILPHNFWHAN